LEQLLVLHGQMAKKLLSTLLGVGKDSPLRPKKRKDREVTPEAKKVMDQTRRDREGNFRAQARKSDVDYGKRPEERGAMNLEGFKRERGTSTGLTDKDVKSSKRVSPAFSRKNYGGGSVKSSASKMGKVKTAKPSMGGASKRADGIAMRGKTRGRMV
jgi:hypothetical protein